jgi:hypothetical protein
MRSRVVSAITWAAIAGLTFANAEGYAPARFIAGILVLVWLVCVAVPWLWRERPPPWGRPAVHGRPPARWSLFGLASLAVMLAGSILTSDERKATLAIILTVLGAAGLFAFSWLVRREKQR